MTPSISFERAKAALLVVDMQPDFMPGGALAVAEGDRILSGIRTLMESDWLSLQVATQDWHPHGHISFASQHPGKQPFDTIELHGHAQTLWPDHCVQGSEGACLHPGLPLSRLAAIVRKGMDPDTDSYSGFRNNWDPKGQRPPTGLGGYLRERGVESVFCCGLARDVCVKWTAEDAVDSGFTTYLLWDLTRAVDPASDARVRAELDSRGVRIIDSSKLSITPTTRSA